MNKSVTMPGSVCLSMIILCLAITSVFAGAAQDQKSETYVSGLTSGRAKSLIGVALGLSSLIIGWRAKARSKNKMNVSRSWPISGVTLGLAAVVLSVLHLAANAGGFGTGGGKAGAIVALVVGVCGGVLSVLALRFKRVSSDG
jgi:hypothetical protein